MSGKYDSYIYEFKNLKIKNNKIMPEVAIKKVKAVNFSRSIKNLTKDKEYPVIAELDEGKYAVVENNKGKAARYRSTIFEEIPEVTPAPPTLEQVIASIQVTVHNNEDDPLTGRVSVLNNVLITLDDLLYLDDTRISCGITQLSNVNVFLNTVYECVRAVEEYLNHLSEDELQELVDTIIYLVLRQIFNNQHNGFILLSTNTNDGNFASLEAAINKLEDVDQVEVLQSKTRNANSGNEIVLYALKYEQE